VASRSEGSWSLSENWQTRGDSQRSWSRSRLDRDEKGEERQRTSLASQTETPSMSSLPQTPHPLPVQPASATLTPTFATPSCASSSSASRPSVSESVPSVEPERRIADVCGATRGSSEGEAGSRGNERLCSEDGAKASVVMSSEWSVVCW